MPSLVTWDISLFYSGLGKDEPLGRRLQVSGFSRTLDLLSVAFPHVRFTLSQSTALGTVSGVGRLERAQLVLPVLHDTVAGFGHLVPRPGEVAQWLGYY